MTLEICPERTVPREPCQENIVMNPIDRAIIDFVKSRNGIIVISIALTICGFIFILMTGRYELSFFVFAALLPWVELWFRRRKK